MDRLKSFLGRVIKRFTPEQNIFIIDGLRIVKNTNGTYSIYNSSTNELLFVEVGTCDIRDIIAWEGFNMFNSTIDSIV